jgi:hypothetical protein
VLLVLGSALELLHAGCLWNNLSHLNLFLLCWCEFDGTVSRNMDMQVADTGKRTLHCGELVECI